NRIVPHGSIHFSFHLHRRLDHGPPRTPPLRRLRSPPPLRIPQKLLGRHSRRLSSHQQRSILYFSLSRIPPHRRSHSRQHAGLRHPGLDRRFRSSRPLRRIRLPRLLAVHTHHRHGLLAIRLPALGSVWPGSRGQSRGKQVRPALRRVFRSSLLFIPSPHRQSLVGRRFPRRLGLGSDFFLWSSRQRYPRLPQPVQLRIRRPHLDYWRQCGSRSQRLHSHSAIDRSHRLQPRIPPRPANREGVRKRDVGCRVPHPNVGLFDVRVGFHNCPKLGTSMRRNN